MVRRTCSVSLKAATAAANEAGQAHSARTWHGIGPGPNQNADKADAKHVSTTTREQRKAETLEARKKGELRPAGQ